jgi:hypothetical protein
MKRPNVIPSQPLNVALPLPLYVQLSAHLYSELEGRVPHGAFSRFMINLLRAHFTEQELDLAPWTGVAPGAYVLHGSPETLEALRRLL